jgi:hypothetical protein
VHAAKILLQVFFVIVPRHCSASALCLLAQELPRIVVSSSLLCGLDVVPLLFFTSTTFNSSTHVPPHSLSTPVSLPSDVAYLAPTCKT